MSKTPDIIEKTTAEGHTPVLLREAVDLLNVRDSETYLDCTFGGGGHTSAILRRANCRVVAVDRDPKAVARAEKVSEKFGNRFEFKSLRFSEIDSLGCPEKFAGILFDFGVSSFQLDEAERGFSISREGPLDMRMNPSAGTSALEYLRGVSENELVRVLRDYGEEPKAKKIARAILAAVSEDALKTTTDLARVIVSAAPSREKIHPATRSFQAIRIAVNNELGEIETALPKAFSLLKSGGVIAAISFHSLEDRIVKKFFKKMAGRPEDRFDRSFVQDRIKRAEILTSKPVRPSEEEIALNPRSRSAKLRALKKD